MKYFLPALLLCLTGLCSRAQDIFLNNAFGHKGVVIKSPPEKSNVFYEQATSVIELPGNKLLVTVDLNNTVALARHMPDGSLDKTYGKDGFSEFIKAAQTQTLRTAGGKILLIGTSVEGPLNFLVVRYDENGNLDAGFGSKGTITIASNGANIQFYTAALQADGKILIGGRIYSPDKTGAFIMRLLPDGQMDASFGTEGFLLVGESQWAYVSKLVPNGTKILAGLKEQGLQESDFTLMQFLEDGTTDSTFGSNGLAKAGMLKVDDLASIAVANDGKIIAAGASGDADWPKTSFSFARLLPNGQLDKQFNRTGTALLSLGSVNHEFGQSFVDAKGRIVVAGSMFDNGYKLVFARLSADGSLDAAYGDGGKKSLPLEQASATFAGGASTSDGSLIAVGRYWPFASSMDYLLAKLDADGHTDEQFGNNGLSTGYFPGKISSITQPKLFANGKVLCKYDASGNAAERGLICLRPDGTQDLTFGENGVLKTSTSCFGILPRQQIISFETKYVDEAHPGNIVMRRYTKDGKPDASFGNGGLKVLELDKDSYANGWLQQPDGKVLLTGYNYVSSGPQSKMLGFIIRMDAEGNLDNQFGSNGKILFDAGLWEVPEQLITQPDGKIVARGSKADPITYQVQGFIRRFTANGLLDESFGTNGTTKLSVYDFAAGIYGQSDGKVLVKASFYDNQQFSHKILRYTKDGLPDETFGASGLKIPGGAATVLQNDKILVAYSHPNAGGNDAALALLNPEGSLDGSFGTKGTLEFKLTDSGNELRDLVAYDNNIFATGLKITGLDQEGLLAGFIIQGGSKDTAVSGFTLVNASANKDIQELRNGDVLDLTLLPRVALNIRANTSPTKVGSVVFELTGQQKRKYVENGAPYALFKNLHGDYFGGDLQPGDYILTATPYSKAAGKGGKGSSLTVRFKIVYTAAVTRFVLVDAATGKAIREISNGDVLNLAKLPASPLSVRAITSPDTVGSMVLSLQGAQSHQQTENLAPYALYGDNKKTYVPWAASAGDYTLTATPYSAAGGKGAKGKRYSVPFSVVQNREGCTEPSFGPVVSSMTQTSGGGYWTSSGDFNRDGKPDIVLLQYGAGYVTTMMGKGDGSFEAPSGAGSGKATSFNLVTGDFNGDGTLDLAVTNPGDGNSAGINSFSIMLGLGDGSFGFPAIYNVGYAQATAMAAADFNGDGKLDLVLALSSPAAVNVMFGNGDGTFGAPVAYSAGGVAPNSILVEDFNGDGKKDLAMAYNTNFDLGVMLNKGDGTFQDVITHPGSHDLRLAFLATADFNLDGIADLALTDNQVGDVVVWKGKGDGSFVEAARNRVEYVTFPFFMVVGDFNGDDIPDVATGVADNNVVAFMFGKGDGSLAAPVSIDVNFQNGLTVADFNGDGKTDVGFTGHDNNFGVLLNTCKASIPPAPTATSPKLPATVKDQEALILTASPNPFTLESIVRFSVPATGQSVLNVYNSTGAEVAKLYQGQAESGREYRVSLHAEKLPAGVYLLRLTNGNQVITAKIVLQH